MEKIIRTAVAGMLAVSLLAGCETTKNAEKKNEDKQKLAETLRPTLTESEKANLAEAILDRMMTGLNGDDYAMYSGSFFQGLKDQLPEKAFKSFRDELKKDMGEYKSRQYLGMLNKKLVDVFIWKAKFSNSDDECLIRLSLVEDEGVYKVLGFNISKI